MKERSFVRVDEHDATVLITAVIVGCPAIALTRIRLFAASLLRRDSLRLMDNRLRLGRRQLTQTCLPSRSSPKASEGWLAVRDDFRNWVMANAA